MRKFLTFSIAGKSIRFTLPIAIGMKGAKLIFISIFQELMRMVAFNRIGGNFNSRLASLVVAMLVSFSVLAQVPAPAPAQSEPIAIMNVTAHLGNGKVIENAIITFENGKIKNVVNATNVRIDLRNYKQIKAQGMHAYPGLILPVTQLGLVEYSAVRASRDFSEVGNIKPHVRSAIAYNTDSELLPTMKFTGIQLLQVSPSGGRVEGTSSIMQLDAWNWEDALYQEDDAVHMNWPALTIGPKWWLGETERKENEKYDEQVAEVEQLLKDTKSYIELQPAEKNLKLEAMIPVLTGEKGLFVYANRPKQIIEAVQTLKKYGIERLVITGAQDAWYVKDLLKENNIPVLLTNVHRLPTRTDEAVDMPFRLPGMLAEEGITVGLTHVSGMISSSRNLPFFAGTVAAYGTDKEEALKMVTSNTAKILGIDDHTGTLESGKDANIVISEGDLLDMRTNIIKYSFIQGREVDLEALQQRLYEKFKSKYESQGPGD